MKRVLTALLLVPFGVFSAIFAPWWLFVGIVAMVAVLCFREYVEITGAFLPLGVVSGLLILISPPHELPLLMILSALASMCLPLAGGDLETAVHRAALLAMGILYIFGSWKCAILLHDINKHWLLFAMMVNWIGDTGAYYVGRNFGRRKLAPAVSPGKTWEGAIASAVTGVIFGLIYLPLAIKGTSLLLVGLLSLAANVAGQVGDLAESAIKRGGGVKDSGTLLPGHGGVLDRLDSTMFALPVLYGLLTILR